MGTLPIKASTLRFSLAFDVYNKTLTFTDLLQNYLPYGASMKGLLSLVDPDGIIFYQNPGWSAHDFSSPDINDLDPNWAVTLSGTHYPMDSNGNVKLGFYTWNYMVTTGTTPSVTVSIVKKLDYVKPGALISMVDNILASTLTVADITPYNISHNSLNIIPTITRLMTIKYPVDPLTGSPVVADVTTTADTITIGPDIYTRVFTALLQSLVVYNLELWDSVPCLIVSDTISGNNYLDVKADNCMCLYYNCIAAVQSQMDASEGNDPAQYQTLRVAKTKLNDYILLYQWALSCGKNAAHWCTLIKKVLLETVPCDCAEDDAAPVEIIPVISGGGSSPAPFSFLFDYSNVSFIGTSNTGNYHWYTDWNGTTGTRLYLQAKVGGVWIPISSNLYVTSTTPPTPATIIYNNSSLTGTDAGTSEKTLDTETITPSDYIDSNGDVLHVYSMFQLAQNDHGKTMNLYFGGDIILTKFIEGMVNSLNNTVVMELWITRTDVATQNITTHMERYGENANTFITKTKTLTASQEIKMTGQNAVATANDIVSMNLKIEVIKIIPTV